MILRNPCLSPIYFVTLQHIQDVLRVWAAAQQISSKLGSAFALHHTWIVNQKEAYPLPLPKRRGAQRQADTNLRQTDTRDY